MFTIKRISPNRLDIHIDGKIDRQQMASALDELISESADIENGVMLYEISNFHLPSLGAFAAEARRLPALLGLIKKFDRVAVLTDKRWLKKVSEIEGALMPNMQIKAFNIDQKEQAESWLSNQDNTKNKAAK